MSQNNFFDFNFKSLKHFLTKDLKIDLKHKKTVIFVIYNISNMIIHCNLLNQNAHSKKDYNAKNSNFFISCY